VTARDATGRVVARTSIVTGPVLPHHWMTVKLRDQAGQPIIPRDLTEHETPATLARVPVGFTQPRRSTGGEFRFDWPLYNEGWGIGGLSSRELPEHRIDWVSTGGPYRWGQEAYVSGLTFEIDQRTAYRPGPADRRSTSECPQSARPEQETTCSALGVPAIGVAKSIGLSVVVKLDLPHGGVAITLRELANGATEWIGRAVHAFAIRAATGSSRRCIRPN